MSAQPVEQVAEANARRKAALIALYAWRLGITFDELGALEYSDKHDRHRPTLRRFAAAAFKAAGVDENVPHSRTSDTWRYLRVELDELADRERYGFDPPPARDLLEQRGDWIPAAWPDVAGFPPDLTREQLAAATPAARRIRPVDLVPYAADERPALVASGCPPLLKGSTIAPPRGWLELAELGPLEPARSCRWCGAAAIIGTPNGWRCSGHWPVPGDPKGDWGWRLNWAPKPERGPCLRAVCYCGRCPHYDVTCQPLQSLRGAPLDATAPPL